MSAVNESPESSGPNSKITRMLTLAAEQRARGVGWKAIAASLGRAVHVWNQWLQDYPVVWDRLLRSAEGRVFREAGAEALQILRGLLRSKDEKICRDVGRTLATLMFRSSPRDDSPENPEIEDPLDQWMREMSPEKLDEHLHAAEEELALAERTSND